MQCVIIAGGKGTRLEEVLGGLPKPLAAVGGCALIDHQIKLAKEHGFDEVLILTGHGAEAIEQHVGDGSRFGLKVSYYRESRPLGTAGAVIAAYDLLDETFLVIYGDTMLNVNLRRLMTVHPVGVDATLFLHPNSHPFDSDLVEISEQGWVWAIHPHPHPPGSFYRNLVNAALYVFEKRALESFRASPRERQCFLDFGKHVFPSLVNQGRKLFGYISREYVRDAGTPSRLAEVLEDYQSGKIAGRSLETPLPAVFLDRDGTLNFERGWLNDPSQLELYPGAADAVRRINEAGYLAVLITNQPVVARGECTRDGLRLIHDKLEWLLAESGAFLDGIFFCPHHPDKGFPGELPELKIACSCRKPAVGLFDEASSALNIDLARSWMVGDGLADIQAARTLGIRSILVRTGNQSKMASAEGANVEVDSLLEAVDFIFTSRTLQTSDIQISCSFSEAGSAEVASTAADITLGQRGVEGN